MSRLIVKVGSNVLTRSDGMPNVTNMSQLVDQIAYLYKKGHEIILVSSGAVACGRSAVKPTKELDPVEARQIFSSVGQIRLINLYNMLFGAYGITVGQVLTQKENFSSRSLYLNQRNCLLAMIDNGIIPVVNENDTASLTELMFTDNDELSGLMATMMNADTLIILSNIAGLYTGNPADPDSKIISVVKPGEDLSKYISDTKSGYGRGGMHTKSGIATKVAAEGISVRLARGDRKNVLIDLVENPESVPHTLFEPAPMTLSSVKRWIAHSGAFAKGVIRINENAKISILSNQAVSLLPIGITEIEGNWEEGDIVSIYGPDNTIIAIGKAALSSEETLEYKGHHNKPCIVHYDYLYIV